jgi:hypothetical protein
VTAIDPGAGRRRPVGWILQVLVHRRVSLGGARPGFENINPSPGRSPIDRMTKSNAPVACF